MVGCTNGTLLLIDVTHVPYKFSRFAVHSSGIDQIVFSNDFTFMATASWDKLIRLYNYHEFFEMSNSVMGAINFDNLKARARSLFFTTDKKLVAGMSDKSIRIWETSSEKLVSLICGLLKRDMSVSEWTDNVGIEIPYEKTCKRTP
jgi:WD40 repeat protein